MVLKRILLRLVAVVFLLQTIADVAKPKFRSSNVPTLGCGKTCLTMKPNSQNRNVVLSQRKGKTTEISNSFSTTPKKKDHLKINRPIGGYKKLPSCAMQRVNHKKSSRNKRDLFGGTDSPGFPGGNQSPINGISSSGLVNESVKSSSIAETTIRATTKLTTQRPLDQIGDIDITCDMDHLSCKNRCAKERSLRQTNDSHFLCYCDDYCETFTDCCYDYSRHCKNDSAYSYTSVSRLLGGSTSNISNSESTSDNYFKCISSKGSDPSGTNGIRMIADCPDNFQKTPAQAKCVVESSLTYQNHKDTPL